MEGTTRRIVVTALAVSALPLLGWGAWVAPWEVLVYTRHGAAESSFYSESGTELPRITESVIYTGTLEPSLKALEPWYPPAFEVEVEWIAERNDRGLTITVEIRDRHGPAIKARPDGSILHVYRDERVGIDAAEAIARARRYLEHLATPEKFQVPDWWPYDVAR